MIKYIPSDKDNEDAQMTMDTELISHDLDDVSDFSHNIGDEVEVPNDYDKDNMFGFND